MKRIRVLALAAVLGVAGVVYAATGYAQFVSQDKVESCCTDTNCCTGGGSCCTKHKK